MNAIEIKALTKRYDGFTLDNIDLVLPSGCIMGLVGENGAGKSTIIKLILNIIQKDSGTIRILGKDNNEENIRCLKEDIGIVLDEIGISECLNAVQVDQIMKRSFKNWSSDVFFSYVKKFSISERKKFHDYSRGMKMKLGIAIALSHSPKLLILDEATSGLDPVIRDEIIDIINDFTRNENHSVLMSSHVTSDLEKICDYVAFLHKGQLILCEEKDILRDKYAFIKCSSADLSQIPCSSIVGKKDNKYCVEAIVLKSDVPGNIEMNVCDIEQLFVFMVRE